MATILLLNGDESTSDLLTELFTWAGHRVVLARDVEEARRRLDQEPVDLVVTERVVPWPGGKCVPAVLKEAAERAGAPMLVWTADVLDDDRQCIIDAGAYFLPKPATLQRLVEAVERLLRGGDLTPA